jgi:chromosome transmission fidelity protein 1
LNSFDHIVSKDAILPIVLSKGPSGKPFLFNYANRGNNGALQELASTLVNVCNVVPAGVVCFFSSYDYLDMVYKNMEASGLLKRLELRKVVFKETRNSNQADNILMEYAKRIKEQKEKSSSITSKWNYFLLHELFSMFLYLV